MTAIAGMEILASDLRMILGAFEFMDGAIGTIDGAHQVELLLTNECGDVFRIGYGENVEVALLGITLVENGSRSKP